MGQQGIYAAKNPGSWRKSYCWVLMVYLLLPMYAWSSEAALRVAFVYNFLKFIEWTPSPSESQPTPGPSSVNPTSVEPPVKPLILCALGVQDDMREALDQLNNRSINKRPIVLTYFDDNEVLAKRLSTCHLVYWPDSPRRFSMPEPFPGGIVLVADEGHAGKEGVSIGLQRTRDGRIEFTVNEPAVEHAGVRISSQLLKLAKNYRDGASNSQGGAND